jgi:hypothetical protein
VLTHPTEEQIKAVHTALYRPAHIEKLKELRRQCTTLMNFNGTAELSPHDIRNPAGSGPTWFILDNGQVDPFVKDGADLCDQIAHTILAIRSEVSKVAFPAADKHDLLKAMQEEAASWTARGQAWRAPGTLDVEAAVNEINGHVEAALEASKHLQHYFKPAEDVLM